MIIWVMDGIFDNRLDKKEILTIIKEVIKVSKIIKIEDCLRCPLMEIKENNCYCNSAAIVIKNIDNYLGTFEKLSIDNTNFIPSWCPLEDE